MKVKAEQAEFHEVNKGQLRVAKRHVGESSSNSCQHGKTQNEMDDDDDVQW